MSAFITKVEKRAEVDVDGNEKISTIEQSTSIMRNGEPDYIKVYTNMWAEFNGVPTAYRELFLQLAIRMSYCNSDDLKNAQLVYTGKPFSDSIMQVLNWKVDMYNRGLRELTKVNAIKRVARGVYQINPHYIGKGEWKYNPRLKRGGVEDLIAVFKFNDKTVDTKIVWADDGEDDLLSETYRNGLNVNKADETIIKYVKSTKKDDDGIIGQVGDLISPIDQSTSSVLVKTQIKTEAERAAV